MILVTGATGLLGSNLLFELSKGNEPVRAIYRSEKKKELVRILFQKLDDNGAQLFNKIEWFPADVLDIVALEDAFVGVKEVYHCAALVSFNPKDFHLLLKINRQGTNNIVNLCLENNIKKLCYVSSTAAVGKTIVENETIVVENNKWTQDKFTNGYSISKYSAEKEVWRGIEEGLNAVIINPSVIFGPGLWSESSMKIFRTIQNGLLFYSSGANAFVDVRDVVKAMIFLQNSDYSGERFLCTGTNISFKELLELIAQELKVKPPRFLAKKWMSQFAWRFSSFFALFGFKPTLTKDSVHSAESVIYYDSTKLKRILPFEFKSLDDTIRFAVQNKL